MPTVTDFTTLTFAEVCAEIDAIAQDTPSIFGLLNEAQLNWRARDDTWSIGQCFEHLLTANRQMLGALEAGTSGAPRQTLWQRLPLLPGVVGRLLVRSQSPTATQKFKAPTSARPPTDRVGASVIARFVDQQREIVSVVRRLDADHRGSTIVASPFVGFITYSVLDACRLIAAHERRHLEQARRVLEAPDFPVQ